MSKDIKNILKSIETDWLTGILEPYTDEAYQKIILLNITKEDLLNKNNNIHQVGKVPYGNNFEIIELIYSYFSKCFKWHANGKIDELPGVHLIKSYEGEIVEITPDENKSIEEVAEEEAKIIIDDESGYPDNTSLILLYCEGTYIWCLGG